MKPCLDLGPFVAESANWAETPETPWSALFYRRFDSSARISISVAGLTIKVMGPYRLAQTRGCALIYGRCSRLELSCWKRRRCSWPYGSIADSSWCVEIGLSPQILQLILSR